MHPIIILIVSLAGKLVSGHDVSDGGLITALLEMSFAGVHGLAINVTSLAVHPIHILFAEEVGWLLEVSPELEDSVKEAFTTADVPVVCIGSTGSKGMNSKVNYFIV